MPPPLIVTLPSICSVVAARAPLSSIVPPVIAVPLSVSVRPSSTWSVPVVLVTVSLSSVTGPATSTVSLMVSGPLASVVPFAMVMPTPLSLT